MKFEQWKDFKKGDWESEINVRDFIQKNYTPYEGDSSFLTGTTEKTKKLWNEVLDLYKKEHDSEGGVLDIDTKTISTVASHEAGYIDKESLTNATSDCRTKFYEDKFGVFTYWAGTWATNLKTNLEANGLDSELVAIPPIEELGAYTERVAPAWCITEACENPEGVYKYFIESMLDGGDMQFLWTYGVEGVHWSTAAEEVCGVKYEEGQFHMLENREKEGTVYTKNHIDPMLAVAPLENDPKADAVAEEAKVSAETFQEHSKMAQLVVSTDEMAEYNGDLTTLKNEVIAKVVTQGMSVEDGMAYFDQQGGNNWSQKIVDSLNN